MLKTSLSFCCVLLALVFLSSCQEQPIQIQAPELEISQAGLLPIPSEIQESDAAFALSESTQIVLADDSEIMKLLGRFAAEKIFQKTGVLLSTSVGKAQSNGNHIFLNWSPDSEAAPAHRDIDAYLADPYSVNEAYEMEISNRALQISSASAAGLFRALQTLRQLLPEGATHQQNKKDIWALAGGQIKDAPAYAYRGAMLDVARHFFSPSEVKRYIDQLAYYKINTLHLHLTDDQGWRLEIKAWPKLTEIGGQTEVGGKSGGFYTQDQYRDLVAYAAAHFMTIVPEVDMPGHTNAASVAYPFLNGNGKEVQLYTGTAVGFSSWDANKEAVYDFVTDVVGEITALSPGPYFHLGGDESHVTPKADYIKFVDRVTEIVRQAGKTPMGWDEIVTAHTDSSAVAQFWASEKNAALAVEKGMKVLLSPAKKAYLDMQYHENSPYGLHWAGYVPVDTAYIWTPETYAKGVPKELILGIEAPLWSETISNSKELEFLAFPRLPGYAELAWSIPENRSWEAYKKRLAKQSHYFDRQGIGYYPSPLIDWETPNPKEPKLAKD